MFIKAMVDKKLVTFFRSKISNFYFPEVFSDVLGPYFILFPL